MQVIVVTGGIGSGKTTATEYFRSRGAVVLDLDRTAHSLLEPGNQPHSEIVEAFGPQVLDARGHIDRSALAETAFASKQSCAQLNAIMHPAVAEEVLARLGDLRKQDDPPRVVVLEVPLLVEAPLFADVADTILAVSAEEGMRIRRCIAFGRAEDDARARLACQATDAEREAIADRTISNEGTPEEFLAELERFWDEVVESRAA